MANACVFQTGVGSEVSLWSMSAVAASVDSMTSCKWGFQLTYSLRANSFRFPSFLFSVEAKWKTIHLISKISNTSAQF